MARNEHPTRKKAEEGGARKALLFELENMAADGHRLVYEAFRSVLKDKGIALSPASFSRYCICQSLPVFVPILLKIAGKERLSADKLCSDMTAAVNEAFKSRTQKLGAPLKLLLAAAADRGLLLGALSRLDDVVSERLAEHLGLEGLGVRTIAQNRKSRALDNGEGWAALARNLSVRPARCVALVSSAPAAQAVQSIRMRCVAIPCEFTAFQDFGGVDYILPSIEDVNIDRLIALLESKW